MPAYVKPPDMLMLCLPPSGIYLGGKEDHKNWETARRRPGSSKIGERRQNGLLGPTNVYRTGFIRQGKLANSSGYQFPVTPLSRPKKKPQDSADVTIVGVASIRTAWRIELRTKRSQTLSKGYVPSDGTLRCSSACSPSANATSANTTSGDTDQTTEFPL